MTTVDDVLAHFGVKGMKWGVRKRSSAVTVTTRPGGRIKTTGGHDRPASTDAVKAARLGQRAKKSSPKSLSNEELRALINRMNLEQQYNNLRPRGPADKAGKFISDVLLGVGKQQATKVASDFATQQVSKALK